MVQFPKIYVLRKAICVKIEKGAVIQTQFLKRNNVYLSNGNYIV